jgi:hypothetical protein
MQRKNWGGLAVAQFSWLLALSAAFPVFAQQDVIEQARGLLSSGNPKQAYMTLLAVQDKHAGKIDFDYVLGVAALDSNKYDEAIIAFERVLAANPRHAGAKLDLARAYYTSGTYDLAEATFLDLKQSNPPPLAQQTIERYLTALGERKKVSRPGFTGYGEMGLGYDSNLTGVPRDFSAAVLSAFNLPGVDPTGNSIKRSAAFMNAAAGFDYYHPLSRGWSAFAGGDVRGRGYRNEADFNSASAEARFGGTLNQGPQQWRLAANVQRFTQKGEAPGDPQPTNDRNLIGIGGDWRRTLDQKNQIGINLQVNRQRFPDNDVEDFNQALVAGTWQHSFLGKGLPLLYLSGFYSDDRAVRKLLDGEADKSKRVAGARGMVQVSLSTALQVFAGAGYTQRKDRSAFARATAIEFGQDRLADAAFGMTWKFQPKCGLRAQWLYSRNASNIDIYDYSRNEVSSTIRCNFG